MSDEKNVLELYDICKKYKNKVIIKNLSLTLKSGEIVGVLGKNGVGKTTLFKIILGLVKKDQGELLILGEQCVFGDCQAYDKVTGMIEHPCLYEWLSGYDNLIYYASLFKRVDNNYIFELINRFELQKYIYKKVHTYSMGTKQKLYFAMALSVKPRLLVLDEPMNGMDPLMIEEVRMLLLEIAKKEKVTILISSHNLNEIQKLCDTYVFMSVGGVHKVVNKEELNNCDIDEMRWNISVHNSEREKLISLLQRENICYDIVESKVCNHYYTLENNFKQWQEECEKSAF